MDFFLGEVLRAFKNSENEQKNCPTSIKTRKKGKCYKKVKIFLKKPTRLSKK